MSIKYKKRIERIRAEGGDGAVSLALNLIRCFAEGLQKDPIDKDLANDRVAAAYASLVREGSAGIILENLVYYPTYFDTNGELVPLYYQQGFGLADEIYELMELFHKGNRQGRAKYVRGFQAVIENAAQVLGM